MILLKKPKTTGAEVRGGQQIQDPIYLILTRLEEDLKLRLNIDVRLLNAIESKMPIFPNETQLHANKEIISSYMTWLLMLMKKIHAKKLHVTN